MTSNLTRRSIFALLGGTVAFGRQAVESAAAAIPTDLSLPQMMSPAGGSGAAIREQPFRSYRELPRHLIPKVLRRAPPHIQSYWRQTCRPTTLDPDISARRYQSDSNKYLEQWDRNFDRLLLQMGSPHGFYPGEEFFSWLHSTFGYRGFA